MSKLDGLSLKYIRFMRNTAENYYNVGIAGTRGWMSRDSEGFDEGDEKIYKRELARLETSILAIDKSCTTRIVMLHYPPFDNKLRPNEFVDIMRKYNVNVCIYGHLHAEGHKYSVEGDLEGLTLHLVSSDYLEFKLKPIMEVGDENNFD
jgi:predicted phosphohydrolase